MHFALFGDHPDGLDLARALLETGQHHLATYTGPAEGLERLRRWGLTARPVGDVEEVLADPAIEAVIVAGSLTDRPAQLRRALQSERHVLCVHPADQTPDTAYEAALIQGDTGCVLLPLLTEARHPGIERLAQLARTPDGPLGTFRLVEMERWSSEAVLIEAGVSGQKPALPGWDVLRALGGEIAELSAFAAREELAPEEPLLVTGRFERGGLFQMTLLPGQQEPRWRLAVVGSYGRAELSFPLGWPGPSRLSWRDETGELHEETWDTWNPWPALVGGFELRSAEVSQQPRPSPWTPEPAAESRAALTVTQSRLPRWTDAIRCLELDDAARRSVERRRASALEYPEATEEVGFKGTMTLVGCGVLWGVLLLLILSVWFPRLGWMVVPVLVLFLALQLFRWVIPGKQPGVAEERRYGEPGASAPGGQRPLR